MFNEKILLIRQPGPGSSPALQRGVQLKADPSQLGIPPPPNLTHTTHHTIYYTIYYTIHYTHYTLYNSLYSAT